MPMTRLFLILVLTVCAALAGCSSGTSAWQRPAVELPERWSVELVAPGEAPTLWWKQFNDPQLDAVVEQVLQGNNDLAAANTRVRRAQLVAALVGTNRTPSVALAANSSVFRSFDPKVTSRSSGVSGAAFYEPDLWGKLADQREVAAWDAAASEADCRAFASALSVAAARLYWQIALFNQLVALSEADVAYAQKTLVLVRTRYDAGAVSGLETARAELNLSSLQAVQTQLVQQRVQTRHALAVLLSRPPETGLKERPELPTGPLPAIAPGVPAAILANRPDLHAAELRLRETFANVDITRASFYPTLTLTGTLGTASAELVKLLQNPVATIAANLALPFVQWNTRQLSVAVSEAQYEEAVANFRQTLLNALRDVEDGLSARGQLMAEAELFGRALQQARRAESIAEGRYRAGAVDLQQWLDAQAARRGAERSVAANRLNQLANQADLYRSLGLGMRGVACRQSPV